MKKRVLIHEESVYKSNLNSGLIAFMSLICIDFINIVVNQLKKTNNAEFPSIAQGCEEEISKILVNFDLKELRKVIASYRIVDVNINHVRVKKYILLSNKKVLDYLDEQLYINILNCVYDLLIKAYKSFSMEPFSKKIRIGKKICEALYAELSFEEAINILAVDINSWINYNFLDGFCKIEDDDEGLLLKVTI